MRALILGLGLIAVLFVSQASAGLVPDGVLSFAKDGDNVDYDYSIHLTNTAGSDNTIGTFWFAWVPAEDFMANKPISVTSPTGWVAALTHIPNVVTNGWAIQWKASTSAFYIPVGGSLDFAFVSAETPDQLAGPSPFFTHPPETTSFVYNKAPFSPVSDQFVVRVSTPEPATFVTAGVGLIGALGMCVHRRRARNRRS